MVLWRSASDNRTPPRPFVGINKRTQHKPINQQVLYASSRNFKCFKHSVDV